METSYKESRYEKFVKKFKKTKTKKIFLKNFQYFDCYDLLTRIEIIFIWFNLDLKIFDVAESQDADV